MNVTYFEYYPHYMGTTTAKVQMDVMTFLFAQHAAVDSMRAAETWREDVKNKKAAEFDFDVLLENIEDNVSKKTLYAFSNLLTNDAYVPNKVQAGANRVLADLVAKGFFVGQWEEGSYYVAIEGFEKKAATALAMLEAQHLADGFDDEDF